LLTSCEGTIWYKRTYKNVKHIIVCISVERAQETDEYKANIRVYL